jgi:hypothetical protein
MVFFADSLHLCTNEFFKLIKITILKIGQEVV